MTTLRRTDEDIFPLMPAMDRFFGPQLMERFFGPALARMGDRQELAFADWAPAVDVSEDDKAYHLHVDLPAVQKKDIEVTLDDGMLTIKGERHQESREDDPKRRMHRIERSYGRFQRSFTLPDDVDSQGIQANAKEGVLEVTLPKTEKRGNGKHTVKVV